jgi:hypothetical protein
MTRNYKPLKDLIVLQSAVAQTANSTTKETIRQTIPDHTVYVYIGVGFGLVACLVILFSIFVTWFFCRRKNEKLKMVQKVI